METPVKSWDLALNVLLCYETIRRTEGDTVASCRRGRELNVDQMEDVTLQVNRLRGGVGDHVLFIYIVKRDRLVVVHDCHLRGAGRPHEIPEAVLQEILRNYPRGFWRRLAVSLSEP